MSFRPEGEISIITIPNRRFLPLVEMTGTDNLTCKYKKIAIKISNGKN